MKSGIKHLIECHCVLPQYRTRPDAVYHKFVVFSEIDDGIVTPKHAQCNNCGVIHRVIDIGKSEISLGKESSGAIMSIADIKLSLPQAISNILQSYSVDLATWEEAHWIIDNEKWGSYVILSSEYHEDTREGKYLLISGRDQLKIESYVISSAFPVR